MVNQDYIAVPRPVAAKMIKDFCMANFSMQVFAYMLESRNIETALTVAEVCAVLNLRPQKLDSCRKKRWIKGILTEKGWVYSAYEVVRLAERLQRYARHRQLARIPALEDLPESHLWPDVPGVTSPAGAPPFDPDPQPARQPRPRLNNIISASARAPRTPSADASVAPAPQGRPIAPAAEPPAGEGDGDDDPAPDPSPRVPASSADVPTDNGAPGADPGPDGPRTAAVTAPEGTAAGKPHRMRTVAPEDLPAMLGIDMGGLEPVPAADGGPALPPWDEEPAAAPPEDAFTAPAADTPDDASPDDAVTSSTPADEAGQWPAYPKRPVYPELPTYLAKQSMRKTKPAPAAKPKNKPKKKAKPAADPSIPDGLDPALFADLPPMPDRLDDFDALRLDFDELEGEPI